MGTGVDEFPEIAHFVPGAPLPCGDEAPTVVLAPSTGHLRLRAFRATEAQATVGRGAGRGSYRFGAFSLLRVSTTTGIGRCVRRA
jgi:hypothetical protein